MPDTETKEAPMKLHLAEDSESVWAIELENNTCRINNCPFFGDSCGFDDIVEWKDIDGIRTFVKVITKVTESWGVTWEPTDGEEHKKEWKQICDHLHSLELHFEGMMAGMFVIALPAKNSDEVNWSWLKAVCYSCPIKLTPYSGGDPKNAEHAKSDS